MKKELSWKKELELARDYVEDGPEEFPKSYMDRCIKKVIEKAKRENVDISKEVKNIERIWNSH